MIEQYAAELRRLKANWHQPFEEFIATSNLMIESTGHLEYWDRLSFPGGLEAGMRRLQNNDAETVEVAIRFLEVDPLFFARVIPSKRFYNG